jgi:hypothetical protein
MLLAIVPARMKMVVGPLWPCAAEDRKNREL